MLDKWHQIQQRELKVGREKYDNTGSYFGFFSVSEFYITDQIAEIIGQIDGPVLDIGCGILPLPNYLKRCRRPYGVDPYIGQSRGFPFCQAIGERIPFKDKTFAAALLMSSLDHVIDSQQVIDESYRLLIDDGQLFIWYINRNRLDGHHLQMINRQEIKRLTAGKFSECNFYLYRADKNVGFPKTEMVVMKKCIKDDNLKK